MKTSSKHPSLTVSTMMSTMAVRSPLNVAQASDASSGTPSGRRRPAAHWTQQEDKAVFTMVQEKGIRKWSEIARMLNAQELNPACKERTGKQCRSRWLNHLDPSINKSPWTPDEEKQLIWLQTQLGNKWSEISRRMKGRTDNDVKNHYNSLLRKRDRTKRKAVKAKMKKSLACPDAESGMPFIPFLGALMGLLMKLKSSIPSNLSPAPMKSQRSLA